VEGERAGPRGDRRIDDDELAAAHLRCEATRSRVAKRLVGLDCDDAEAFGDTERRVLAGVHSDVEDQVRDNGHERSRYRWPLAVGAAGRLLVAAAVWVRKACLFAHRVSEDMSRTTLGRVAEGTKPRQQ
jgi:hypothetical protein